MKRATRHTAARAAITLGLTTLPAAAQGVHEADFILRVHDDALETGAPDGSGGVVFPAVVRTAVFGAEGFANFTNDPGVNSLPGDLTPGMGVGFDLVAAVREWDEVAQDFGTVSDDTVSVRDGGVTVAVSPASDAVVAGDVFGVAGLDADAIFHSHVQFFLNYPSSTPVDGVWLLSWRLWTDEPGVAPTGTLYVVFAQGAGEAVLDDAAAWVEDNLIAPACPCDLDGSGVLNLDDLDAFVAAFLAGDPAADLDGSGAINLDDLDAFVSCFVEGCP